MVRRLQKWSCQVIGLSLLWKKRTKVAKFNHPLRGMLTTTNKTILSNIWFVTTQLTLCVISPFWFWETDSSLTTLNTSRSKKLSKGLRMACLRNCPKWLIWLRSWMDLPMGKTNRESRSLRLNRFKAKWSIILSILPFWKPDCAHAPHLLGQGASRILRLRWSMPKMPTTSSLQ